MSKVGRISGNQSRRRPRWRSLALGALVGLWAAGEGRAGAYCRSTTCTKGCQLDDDGCKAEGQPLAWAGGCVGVSLQRDGTANVPFDAVSDALDRALSAWSEVPCPAGGAASFAYARLPNVACDRNEFSPTGPNANVVLFRDNDWRYTGEGNTLGFTTVTFVPSTGVILGADIEVNAAYNELTAGDDRVAYDLRSILTHELGHMLGLSHSSDPEATMVADYDKGSVAPRDLADDDVAALCAVYPPGRQASCDPQPSGGLASSCAAPAPEAPADEGCALRPPASGGRGELGALAALAAACRRALRRRGRGGRWSFLSASGRGCCSARWAPARPARAAEARRSPRPSSARRARMSSAAASTTVPARGCAATTGSRSRPACASPIRREAGARPAAQATAARRARRAREAKPAPRSGARGPRCSSFRATTRWCRGRRPGRATTSRRCAGARAGPSWSTGCCRRCRG